MSEWNPTFADDGEPRVSFHWDPEVGAHDLEFCFASGVDSKEPCRTRLSELLADVLDGEDAHSSSDADVDVDKSGSKTSTRSEVGLARVRHLIAALVQKYGRHDRHEKTGPILGKHPCARGKPGCVFCRYGFPQKLKPSREGLTLEKGDREGQWHARFPRNDSLSCSYEPHVLLGNLGNIDWRPCLNFWAVVEYIVKYAMKGPDGSKQLKDVLRDTFDEICRYNRESQADDLLKKSLQKFYSRTLGDRDYTIFEVMFLGLRLPLVNGLMPMDCLNTSGARVLKSRNCLLYTSPSPRDY